MEPKEEENKTVEIKEVNGIKLLPKILPNELSQYLFYNEVDHLRMVCRIFQKKIQVRNEDKNTLVVLDVGCRDSKLREFFNKVGYGWIGLDSNPADNSGIVKGTMENIPYNNESFNLVFSSHSLEHSENIVQALREMKRVCKAGGYIFIATPVQCEYILFLCDKTHVCVPTPIQMRRLMEYVGIQVLNLEVWNVEGQEDKFANLITVGRVI